jgi:hypothetical protein
MYLNHQIRCENAYMSNPFGEWKTSVASKRPCLASCGCVECNVAPEQYEENDGCQAICGTHGD